MPPCTEAIAKIHSQTFTVAVMLQSEARKAQGESDADLVHDSKDPPRSHY